RRAYSGPCLNARLHLEGSVARLKPPAGQLASLPGAPVIDLHCHILDAIDDGARDADDSVAMARQAEADGIEAVCATPHIRDDHDVRIEELAGRVAGLNAKLEQELVAVRILQGGEVAETAVEGLSEEELTRLSLGGGAR